MKALRGKRATLFAASTVCGLIAGLIAGFVLWKGGSTSAGDNGVNGQLTREPRVLWSVDTRQKLVALTFDDGPDPRISRKVLKILRGYGVKATFFVEGRNVVRYPQVLRAEAAEGHEIGNHTMNHRDLQLVTGRQAAHEIDDSAQAIWRAIGRRPEYLRPPRGHLDARVLRVAKRLGHQAVMWSLGLERLKGRTPEQSGAWVAAHVRPGAIILAHDSSPTRRWVPKALPPMIRGIQARGFRIVTLSELLAARGR